MEGPLLRYGLSMYRYHGVFLARLRNECIYDGSYDVLKSFVAVTSPSIARMLIRQYGR